MTKEFCNRGRSIHQPLTAWLGPLFADIPQNSACCYPLTLRFFVKFVSQANCSKSYPPTKRPRKQKNVALEKFLENNHPQTLRLFSRRGPRSPDARLSQHYSDPKMTFQHFSNFYRKKFPGLTKEISCTYSRLRNKHRGTLNNFWIFFQGLYPY